jgi:sugar/nucleoside kinase (ribokinase family)
MPPPPSPRPRVCVVGSTNVDLTFQAPRLPRAGETLSGRGLFVSLFGVAWVRRKAVCRS